ncbi:MAG: hypothetical protein WD116_00630 [Chloroflexota bacterium]
MKRLAVLISLVAMFSLAFAGPALAAVPGNDDAGSPTVIDSLPFSDSLDTTEATADPSDPDCFGAGSNASVWYAFTTGADPVTLLADTAESDYVTLITVTAGSPTGDAIVACGFGGAQFPTEPATTYYFMVAACFTVDEVAAAAIGCDPDATGGLLVFSLTAAPPPASVDLTIDPHGVFNRATGSATITGTVVCTGEAFFTEIDVYLTQAVGRFTVLGSGYLAPEAFACDGTPQPWSIEISGITGKFKGGRASVEAFAYACGEFDCGFDSDERGVRLR